MNPFNPFHLEEVACRLIWHLHRDTLEQFYLRYPLYHQLLNSARVLEKLQKVHSLHGVFTRFADFVVEYDLNDPVRREDSALSYDELVFYAAKTDNDELFRYAVGRGGKISSKVMKELGKRANSELLESLQKLKPEYSQGDLAIGLFAGGHHDFFAGIMLECDYKSNVLSYLARHGKIELVKKYYHHLVLRNDVVIFGAANTNQLEILRWLGIDEDHPCRINGMISYALRNGDPTSICFSPEILANYGFHSGRYLVDSIKCEHIESVNWVLETYKTRIPEYMPGQIAIKRNRLSIVKYLLQKNPSHVTEYLKKAVLLGRLQVIDWILESQMIEREQIQALINSLYISKGENRCGIRYLKLKMS